MRRFAPTALAALLGASLVLPAAVSADLDPALTLSDAPYTQAWSDTGAISADDSWTGVAGTAGFRGDALTAATGADPQTITADGAGTPLDVNANRPDPLTFATGGVTEFELANPTVALTGSGTADAPHIVWHLNASGRESISFSFTARDLEPSGDDAVQQIAVQYRAGTSGAYTNLPAGYIADATTAGAGPDTTRTVPLPAGADGQSDLYVRVITTNAVGNDEWVGIDDVSISSSDSGGGVNEPPVITCPPSALEVDQGTAGTTGVSASDPDGTVTGISVANVAPSPATGTISRTSLTPAAGDGGTASAEITASSDLAPGVYTVTVTAANDDAAPQTASCSFTVYVVAPIGVIQGAVGDGANGATHRSPFAPPSGNGAGKVVVVKGLITQRTRQRRASDGATQYGFFIQNTAATADADPTTSDGIFVFMSTFTDLIGGYVPQVGDEIVLRGTVSEFFSLTQLSSASMIRTVSTGNAVDSLTPPFVARPPDDLAEANRYWERLEGMRGEPPAKSVAVDGTDVFPSTADAELWLIDGHHSVATRANLFARRVFRDPHPLDNVSSSLFDDGNGYRILLGSLGVKEALADNTAQLAPARTFSRVNDVPAGGLYFSFNKYQLQPEAQISPEQGINPSWNAPPTFPDRPEEYSIANYNVENLYDYRDDPFDGCDFAGNSGCPGVSPPFDYVPASDASYQERLGEIATQIRTRLFSPEILLVQEAEDQDICSVSGGALSCGTTDNADGRPDTLQELALRIRALGGPTYQAAYDRDGSNDRGIVSAFLYRTDRVALPPAPAADPVLGSDAQVPYRSGEKPYNNQAQNPKALNAPLPADVDTSTGVDGSDVFTRDPQVGLFRIWSKSVGKGQSIDVYAISNHFSSTPDARVGQRREQAAYNAAIVDTIRAGGPSRRVLTGGDFNVFPRPDDPLPGPPPSDQLAPLYDEGLVNLFDVLVDEVPRAAYTYVFQGQAQTLDHQMLTPSLLGSLRQVRVAHINADFPADHAGDAPFGISDHDPVVSRFSLKCKTDC